MFIQKFCLFAIWVDMCTSPIHIKNKSPFFDGSNLPGGYDVPCGECDECRNAYMVEWRTRLQFEMLDAKLKGDQCLFLTFSFNDFFLPHHVFNGKFKPCFDNECVKTFLNRLKARVHKEYGKDSYRYCLLPEFGELTHRPHYHGLFWVRKDVDPVFFAELCRECWVYGFMFPRRKDGKYIDNFGRSSSIFVRSLQHAAVYCCKYVCKDMSFYDADVKRELSFLKYSSENPYVSELGKTKEDLVHMRSLLRRWLPRHYQSNGLGYGFFNFLDYETFKSYYSSGYVDTFFMEKLPLPKFVVRKFMYYNSFEGRYLDNGKKAYERLLTDSGKRLMRDVYELNVINYFNRLKYVCDNSSVFSGLLPAFDNFELNDDFLYRASVFQSVFRYVDKSFYSLHGVDTSLTLENGFRLFSMFKDFDYKLTCDNSLSPSDNFALPDEFKQYSSFCSIVDNAVCSLNRSTSLVRSDLSRRASVLRSRFNSTYDVSLC